MAAAGDVEDEAPSGVVRRPVPCLLGEALHQRIQEPAGGDRVVRGRGVEAHGDVDGQLGGGAPEGGDQPVEGDAGGLGGPEDQVLRDARQQTGQQGRVGRAHGTAQEHAGERVALEVGPAAEL